MDTITHAFAGALLGKGIFSTQRFDKDTSTVDEYSPRARVAIFAVTLGSAFPDADVFYDWVSRSDLAMLKYHRYVTHSILCMPLWALALALLTQWVARRWGIRSPSFFWLWLCYLVGIASHILLDLATSFGTMVWSPLSRVRPAWDVIFIVDVTMTAILLLPQVAAWINRDRLRSVRRALGMWAVFCLLAVGARWLASAAGFEFAAWYVIAAIAIIAALFFAPVFLGWGSGLRRSTWARIGLLAASAYLLACTAAHDAALHRVQAFALQRGIEPQALAALPLAPSIWRWDGLIRAAGGTYRLREDLLAPPANEFHFYADSAPSSALATTAQLADARTYLWFARFPWFTFSQNVDESTLEITDLRFFTRRRGRTPGFTFVVTFDPEGKVTSEGMARDRGR